VPATSRPLLHQTWFNALRTLLYASAFVILFTWLALTVRAFDRHFFFALPHSLPPLGVVLMLAGGIVGVTCIATFIVRGRGTPALFDPPTQFVAVGPYRWVRNPMYIGGFTLLLGFAIYLRSVSILLMVLALAPACHLLVVLHEEPSLKRKFGADYENYLRAVSRWLPRAPCTFANNHSGQVAP